jgi:hypothetical protein
MNSGEQERAYAVHPNKDAAQSNYEQRMQPYRAFMRKQVSTTGKTRGTRTRDLDRNSVLAVAGLTSSANRVCSICALQSIPLEPVPITPGEDMRITTLHTKRI